MKTVLILMVIGQTHLNCHPDKVMIYDAYKKKLALQFPDDRRSYTEGRNA